MAVKERYGNWYIDVQMRGIPSVRRRVEAEDKATAQRIEAWVKLQLQAGVQPEDLDLSPTSPRIPPKPKAPGLKLQDAYDKAMREEWGRTRSAMSYYGPVGGVAVQLFGPDKDMLQVTDDDVRRFVEACEKKGDMPRTISARIALLVRLWNIAIDIWEVEGLKHPRWARFRPKKQQGRLRWLTQEEEENLLAILRETDREHAQDAKDFVALLIDTGMRRGEGLALRRTDFNREYGSITISRGETGPTKTYDTRTVPLTKRAKAILEARIKDNRLGKQGEFFPALNKDRLRRLWAYAKRELGLEEDREFVLHATRHTCATRLLERGNDIRLVQQWLGHKDIETTAMYAKVTSQHLAKGAASLDELQ